MRSTPTIFRLIPCALLAFATATTAAVESRIATVEGIDYRLVTVDLTQDRLEAHWLDDNEQAYSSIDALRKWGKQRGRRLLFATNAGIYDRDVEPLGLYIENSLTLKPLNTVKGSARSGNFSMQPNGVFYVDAHQHAGVMTTAAWHDHPPEAQLATQSGPMLVVNGAINAAFDVDSESLKWRSGVCAKSPQNVVFVVSIAPVTFHAFAEVFRDEIGCRDALYLDGTLSQIYTRADGYSGAPAMAVKPYAAMLAVFASDPGKR